MYPRTPFTINLDLTEEIGKTKLDQSARKIFLGIGRVKMQRYQLCGSNACTKGVAVEMVRTVSGIPSIGDSFIPPGTAVLQNLPSIVCCLVLDPRPNETILDMCAAPGNKTTHLAQLIQNQGTVIALDKSENRVRNLRRNVWKRLHSMPQNPYFPLIIL